MHGGHSRCCLVRFGDYELYLSGLTPPHAPLPIHSPRTADDHVLRGAEHSSRQISNEVASIGIPVFRIHRGVYWTWSCIGGASKTSKNWICHGDCGRNCGIHFDGNKRFLRCLSPRTSASFTATLFCWATILGLIRLGRLRATHTGISIVLLFSPCDQELIGGYGYAALQRIVEGRCVE